MGLAPCKDCKDRVLGCHSTCQRYLEFRKEVDRIHEIRNLEKLKNGFTIEAVIRNSKQMEKTTRNTSY